MSTPASQARTRPDRSLVRGASAGRRAAKPVRAAWSAASRPTAAMPFSSSPAITRRTASSSDGQSGTA